MPKGGADHKVKFLIGGKTGSSESLNGDKTHCLTTTSNVAASVCITPMEGNQKQQQQTAITKSSNLNSQQSLTSTSSSTSSGDLTPPNEDATASAVASASVFKVQSSSVIAARRLSRKLSEQKEAAGVASPEEFVQRFGGTRVIKLVLIANNGIAAVKCMRSIRRWCYEVFKNERAIKFVVMYTPEDLKANAEYIRMGDHCVPVPGGSNNNNYANVDLILDIAKRIPVQVEATVLLFIILFLSRSIRGK